MERERLLCVDRLVSGHGFQIVRKEALELGGEAIDIGTLMQQHLCSLIGVDQGKK